MVMERGVLKRCFSDRPLRKIAMIKIANKPRLICTLLGLLTTLVLLPTVVNGQSSKLDSHLRSADLDGDGRMEPHEMTPIIRRYLTSKGYDITQRHKIRDIVRAAEPKTPAAPSTSKLKVPKFGVEPTEKSGVSTFATDQAAAVTYSESVNQRTRELFQRYDQNKNNTLDEAEMQRARWGNPPPSANDKNGDGRLSYSEVQGRYHDMEVAQQRSSQSTSDSGQSNRGGDRSGVVIEEVAVVAIEDFVAVDVVTLAHHRTLILHFPTQLVRLRNQRLWIPKLEQNRTLTNTLRHATRTRTVS